MGSAASQRVIDEGRREAEGSESRDWQRTHRNTGHRSQIEYSKQQNDTHEGRTDEGALRAKMRGACPLRSKNDTRSIVISLVADRCLSMNKYVHAQTDHADAADVQHGYFFGDMLAKLTYDGSMRLY